MNSILSRLVDIREGESARTLLMFIYIFLVITALLILKPIRNSLFLTRFGVEQLPYAFILVALLATAVSTVYNRYAARVNLHRLIFRSMLIIISNLILFWFLLFSGYQAGWFVYFFYVWVAVFGVTVTSQFWVLANHVFDAREAKRLFGFIGAGAISGGIFGGYLTNYLAPLLGSTHLVLICAGCLILCLIISQSVWKSRPATARQPLASTPRRQAKSQSPWQLLTSSKHVLYLAGIVGVGVIVANIVDYQFNAIAEATITDPDELTAFFGFWLSTMSIFSLVIQVLFTGKILSRFGVGVSLFLLPAGIVAGAVSVLFNPSLFSAILLKINDGSLKQSINKAALELLALPIPTAEKAQAKTLIDVLVDSIATGFVGFLLILLTAILGLGVEQISIVVLAFVALWIFLIVRVRSEYLQAFRTAIEKRTVDVEDLRINPADASMQTIFTNLLSSNNERQILYGLSLIESFHNPAFVLHIGNLMNNRSTEIRAQALRMLRNYPSEDFRSTAELQLQDPSQSVRVEALHYLYEMLPAQEQDALVQKYLSSEELAHQIALITILTRERIKDKSPTPHLSLVNEITRILDDIELARLDSNQKSDLRAELAKALGESPFPESAGILIKLFDDSSPKVVRAAITAAGTSGSDELTEPLLNLFKVKSMRQFVRDALARNGHVVSRRLISLLNDIRTDQVVRIQIPRTLSQIGDEDSVNNLVAHLEDTNPMIRREVIRSLNRLRKRFPDSQLPTSRIDATILDTMAKYARIAAILQSEFPNSTAGSSLEETANAPARQLLEGALHEKLDAYLERIFRLLALRYDQSDMYNAYLSIISGKPSIKASAIEFLDNILTTEQKKVLIPIVESSTISAFLDSIDKETLPDFTNGSAPIQLLLQHDDPWLKSCVIFWIAEAGIQHYRPEIEAIHKKTDSQLVQQTASLALEKMMQSEVGD